MEVMRLEGFTSSNDDSTVRVVLMIHLNLR